MQLIEKLSVLADAAKYDVSCASSGAPKRSSKGRSGLGATDGMGPADALVAVLVRDPRQTELQAGVCADGRWMWLR